MKTRIFYTKFWKDEYVASLKLDEKLFFNYMFTNDKVNICGIYELSDREIMFDLGISHKRLSEIKSKFTDDDKFRYCMGWVCIVNYEKYNQYIGEKNQICRQKELLLVPEQIMDTLSIPYTYPIDTPSNHKSEIINKKLVIRDIHNYGDKTVRIAKDLGIRPMPIIEKYVEELYPEYSFKDITLTCLAWCQEKGVKPTSMRWKNFVDRAIRKGELLKL